MIKKICFLGLTYFLFSCGTGLKINRKDFQPIRTNFSMRVNHLSHKTSKSIANLENGPKLLDLFGVFDISTDTVSLSLKNKSLLELTYKDKSVIKTLTFQVKLAKKGFIEILSVNKNIQIPPIIPFLYSNVDLSRTRIGLTTNNELVIDHKWEKSGSVFIFSGGAGGRTQYFFKSFDR